MNSRLRLAFHAPGASIHTRRWIEALAERGHDVLLVSQGPPGTIRAGVFDPYARMGPLARLPKVRALYAQRLVLRHLSSWRPDLVHLHWLNPTLGTLRLVRRLERLVVSVWGRDVVWDGAGAEPWVRRYCKPRILACAEAVTATSRFLASRTESLLASPRSVRVIPFGVDCDLFRPDTGARPQVPVIGYLKHYTPKYGPDVLLRACAILAQRGCPFRLEMYGTDDPEPYRRLAVELGLGDRASLSGAVEHSRVPETLRRFDIYVMPSVFDSETFGVSALEAAACGIPVVASRVGGVPETVLDGETGLLVPPGRPDELAASLQRLLPDAGLRRRLGERGRAFSAASYEWKECVRRMEDLYFEVVGRVKAARRGDRGAGR